ncbi:hypothetical protein [Streptomyces sp. NPDC006551]|uniref:hypothetical protein n=1 Tax=Streptomyces sp. NPDC006551 TaxID=3157178 RepID=UPI0033A3A130
MKHSAAKTLGVAALGAAFAAAAAGTAAAAPVAPATPDALGLVTQTVPLGDGLTELPAGAAESLGSGQGALGTGLDQGVKAIPHAPDQTLETLSTDRVGEVLDITPLGQVAGLLGGLPLNGIPLG